MNHTINAEEKFDIVYTWVDNSDPQYKTTHDSFKKKWLKTNAWDEEIVGEMRDRNNDELKFSLRAAEKFAPWANRVFLLTFGQYPEWMNFDHPKLTIARHTDILPDSFLPTFNSFALEWALHRIPGLSENFIYFNDDYFLGQPTLTRDFYSPENGHMLSFDYDPKNYQKKMNPWRASMKNANQCLEERFGKRFRRSQLHLPHFFRKSVFKEMAKEFAHEANHTMSHKFRDYNDVNATQMYMHYIIDMNYPHTIEREPGFTFHYLSRESIEKILKTRPKFYCLNDVTEDRDNYKLFLMLERLYPDKSSFEN
ncbi:conserved hypothetical protein [Candidatus Desulfarcum epimagneticum]|uniref:Uncharacterized protein n=1 Tax=uncultured Desulfobacteraceae bacterium TaxID=218296 RepID=A0A484HKM2_9BACT|nr:conserved hypothetical protein [uncultured Desulfobacteraceae bacterium]